MASRFLTILMCALLLAGCGEYRKVLRSTDMQYKYDKALEYYKEGKHVKAYPLWEELYIAYRGTEKGEKIAYYQAYSDYHLGDYILAGHRFGQFHENYPNSEHAEECQFMSAYCWYLNSPKFSLDQTDTYKAIRQLQLFAIDNPESTRMDSVNLLLDELRGKLEKKEYNGAMLYFRMEDYKAAIIAFENLLKTYPSTEHKEEVLFLSLKSHYEVAKNSVPQKKSERIDNAIKAYTTFADRFPESKYLQEAKNLHAEMLLERELLNQVG